MSRMVQIRNVPDALHRRLEVRAANAGQTRSDYQRAEFERLAAVTLETTGQSNVFATRNPR